MLFAYIAVFMGAVAALTAIVVGGLGGIIVGVAFLLGAASTFYIARIYAVLKTHAQNSPENLALALAALEHHTPTGSHSYETPRAGVSPLDELVTR